MLQRPHFLPKDKPKVGGADGALREDHLVYGKLLGGRPTVQKALKKPRPSLVSSVLLPLALDAGF